MTVLHIVILIAMIVVSIAYLVGCFMLGMYIGRRGARDHWSFLKVLFYLILTSFIWNMIYQFIVWLLRLALS